MSGDPHLNGDCCWEYFQNPDGVQMRARPTNECLVNDPVADLTADKVAFDRRVDAVRPLMREVERLRDDVLAEDRGEKTRKLMEWIATERDALNDWAELLMMYEQEEGEPS
jgi:hypothetical protein